MNIYPKIDDVEKLTTISKYIRNGVEIHSSQLDVNPVTQTAKDLLKEYKGIKEITIHAPMKMCDIEKAMTDENLPWLFDTIKTYVRLSKQYNIRINVLFHCSHSYAYFQLNKQLWIFHKIINMMKGSKTYLMLENVIEISITKSGQEPIFSVVNMLRSKKVVICFDLCHAHAVINAMFPDKTIEGIYSDNKARKTVRQIHFSDTKNNDGYKDMLTHSRAHDNIESLNKDLDLLKRLGMNKANVVVEIIDSDYATRPDQIAELKLLIKANKERRKN